MPASGRPRDGVGGVDCYHILASLQVLLIFSESLAPLLQKRWRDVGWAARRPASWTDCVGGQRGDVCVEGGGGVIVQYCCYGVFERAQKVSPGPASSTMRGFTVLVGWVNLSYLSSFNLRRVGADVGKR